MFWSGTRRRCRKSTNICVGLRLEVRFGALVSDSHWKVNRCVRLRHRCRRVQVSLLLVDRQKWRNTKRSFTWYQEAIWPSILLKKQCGQLCYLDWYDTKPITSTSKPQVLFDRRALCWGKSVTNVMWLRVGKCGQQTNCSPLTKVVGLAEAEWPSRSEDLARDRALNAQQETQLLKLQEAIPDLDIQGKLNPRGGANQKSRRWAVNSKKCASWMETTTMAEKNLKTAKTS